MVNKPHTTPNVGWSSSFVEISPYTNDADGSDNDFEPEDPTRNLDLSRRPDLATYTRTPFSIAASNASKSKAKAYGIKGETSKQSQGRSNVDIENDDLGEEDDGNGQGGRKGRRGRMKGELIEQLLEEQEAEDRKGGRPISPAIEQPKARKEDTKAQNGWGRTHRGWTNGQGQPVAASRPPPKQSSIVTALQNLDKGTKAGGRKRKAPEPAPVPVPEVATEPPVPLPKGILAQLDAVEGKSKAKKKAKTSVRPKPKVTEKAKGNEGEKSKPKGRATAAGSSKPPPAKSKAKGKKAGQEKNDGDITFGLLPTGAAPTDQFPIVKGLEKMKDLPQRPKRQRSPSNESIISAHSIDLDAMLRSADAKSDRFRVTQKDRQANLNPQRMGLDREDEPMDIDDHHGVDHNSWIDRPDPRDSGRSKQENLQSAYSKDAIDLTEDVDTPLLDHTGSTEPTDSYLTPHPLSTGNPSTITHLSDIQPVFSDGPSSSSQLPYSSPALQRARRAYPDRIHSPQAVRAAPPNINKLEMMAHHQSQNQDVKVRGDAKVANPTGEWSSQSGAERGRMTSGTAATQRSSFRPPLPLPSERRHGVRRDLLDTVDVNMEPEEEWSTLRAKGPRRHMGGLRTGMAANQHGYDEPSTPSDAIPKFRHAGTSVQRPRHAMFKPTPRDASSSSEMHSGGGDYKLLAVPNGARDVQTYKVQSMAWSGAEQKRAMRDREDEARQGEWVRDQQREAQGRGGRDDWKDGWIAENRRQMERNPHRQYAYNNRVKRGGSTSGRAFAL